MTAAPSPKRLPPPATPPPSIGQRMFRRFIAGVLFVLPAVVTIAVVYQIYLLVSHWIIEPVAMLIIPPRLENQYWQAIEAYITPPLSLLVVLGVLYLAGYLFQTRIRTWLNWLFSHVPGVSTIYKAILDVVYAYQGPEGLKKIDEVVLVPFPSDKARMAGYLMSRTKDAATGEELCCVYIPLSLFPPAGYTLIYRAEDIIVTDWDAADGWKILLSAGLTLPEQIPFQLNRTTD